MPKKRKKEKRPSIPWKTQLKLWVLSAGHCEFPGCNKFLLHEDLTFSEGNYSNMAHIVSWSPRGPRGDPVRSLHLAKDITNLMLVCQRCGKLIDNRKNVAIYPEKLLRFFKKTHEERIKIQTAIQEDLKTTVIRLQANLRGRNVKVGQDEVYTALISARRYPADEKGVFIDLTGLEYTADKSYWEVAAQKIKTTLDRGLSLGNDELQHPHLSIFGIAPIPLLVYLGFTIGNTIRSDIYIKLRGQKWFLKQGSRGSRSAEFIIRRPSKNNKTRHAALSIAISGSISATEIYKATGQKMPIYELCIAQPSLDSIQSGKDLESFRKSYRSIMDEIRERYGKKVKVHLLAAIPSCVAIVCGQEILHGVDPSVTIYEHGNQSSGFSPAITIN